MIILPLPSAIVDGPHVLADGPVPVGDNWLQLTSEVVVLEGLTVSAKGDDELTE